MRTLCLNLQQPTDSACADLFLQFSSRVYFRFPNYLFIEIEEASPFCNNELKFLKLTIDLARKFAPNTTGTIADTAYNAQALVHYKPFEITNPHEDHRDLFALPVSAIEEMEGLTPWKNKRHLRGVTHLFQALGLHSLEDLYHIDLSFFRQRWGELGIMLWKRLHQREIQSINPLKVPALCQQERPVVDTFSLP